MDNSSELYKLISPEETAEMLDTTTGTLAVWRSTGRIDLPFVKVSKNVRYRIGDVLDFIERHTMKHTV